MKLTLIYLVFLIMGASCIGHGDLSEDVKDYDLNKVPYRLYEPTEVFKLHYDLQEISGLTYLSENKLAVIEDETGKIYILNSLTGEVEKKIKFEKGGDYEGIELLNGQIVVMKSNGHFYRFNITDKEPEVEVFKSEFSSKNDLEGLGVWKDKLLVATKASAEVSENGIKGKALYLYDFSSQKLLINFEREQLEAFIKDRKHFNSLKDFDPSAVAVHPETSDIYILSADHVLAVYDEELNLKELVKLDKKIFSQPEGICFSPEGKLFISSEGRENRGRLLTFNKHKE